MYDICIVGSGAGASPVAYELSKAGKRVIVLEKGAFFTESDFSKDEIAYTKRSVVTPSLDDEYHVIEEFDGKDWVATSTKDSGWDFWNGNVVGGSSNFMSGFFHRLHPDDFRLKSKFGEIKGANIEDWPISYDELAPFYDKVEQVVGVSGVATPHKYLEPRQYSKFPYPPTQEHPITKLFDKSCADIGLTAVVTPRAILSQSKGNRNACYYSNYCGSYGCSSGAKGSARAALLSPALESGNLTIITNAFVKRLHSDKGRVTEAVYIDKDGKEQSIQAKLFVISTQAVETSRLLLNSSSAEFPNGLANNSGQVGKNLLFSGGGIVTGDFEAGSNISSKELMTEGLFVNRVVKDSYFFDGKAKGGILEVLFEHANPIRKANSVKYNGDKLVWGERLYDRVYDKLNKYKTLNIEIFNDWLPNDDCFVSVDKEHKDRFGSKVAKIRIGSHPQNEKVGNKLAITAEKILQQMGATDISVGISPYPPQNLQAGGCRFGDDPTKSVLNKFCQSHEVSNLFVTDGSFIPTGGSVPYTFTIYANSFRVAEYIKQNWEEF